jgi:hypothetical protein
MLSTGIQHNRRIPVKVNGTHDPYSDKVTFEMSLFTSFFSSPAAKGDIEMAVKPVNDESQQAEDAHNPHPHSAPCPGDKFRHHLRTSSS